MVNRFTPDLILARINSAYEYLSYLQELETGNVSWKDGLNQYEAGSLSFAKAMTLINPRFCPAISTNVQGVRRFLEEPGFSSMKCQSDILWGYDCPIGSRALHADHLFPYTLGGPTIGANKIYLCSDHNSMKSCDLHFYSWESKAEWLDAQIRLIARYAN
jgi:hypothetical protein